MRNVNFHYSKPSHWNFDHPHRHHCLVRKPLNGRAGTNLELCRWSHWFNTEGMMMNNFGAVEATGLDEERVMVP